MVTPGWFLRMCLDSRVGAGAGRGTDMREESILGGGGRGAAGVLAGCLSPLQPLLPHFVARRYLWEMQMSGKQRDCMIV